MVLIDPLALPFVGFQQVFFHVNCKEGPRYISRDMIYMYVHMYAYINIWTYTCTYPPPLDTSQGTQGLCRQLPDYQYVILIIHFYLMLSTRLTHLTLLHHQAMLLRLESPIEYLFKRPWTFSTRIGGNPWFLISPSGISIISPSVSIKTIIILTFWSNLINPLNNCFSWSTSGNFLHLWWWHVVSKTWPEPRRSPHTSMIYRVYMNFPLPYFTAHVGLFLRVGWN